MINEITHALPHANPTPHSRPRPCARLLLPALVLTTVASTGCYRATGIQRTPTVAEVLPETAGDKVVGLKLKGGAGDYYLGNDFIQVAIDSAAYGDTTRVPLAGAPSGGGIVDAGYIQLDNSYNRVSMPGNAMNILTPVVNQDPNLRMVFTQFTPVASGAASSLTMSGLLLDPNNTLGTGTNPVANVSVVHTLAVSQLDRFFTVTTTVYNNSNTPLAIQSIGDFLNQQGGGYHFNIPANFDYQGNSLATPWGVQIPGSDFTQPAAGSPLKTSVQAPMVGLMDSEPAGDVEDSHCSLGILPVTVNQTYTDQLLVAADPQDLLTVPATPRPVFPARLVAGSLATGTSLAPGASLTYVRRLYILGGRSVDASIVGGLVTASNMGVATPYPDQATGLFNLMDTHRYSDATLAPPQDTGVLTFTLSGVAQRQGPLPVEIRIERNVTAAPAPAPGGTATWQVQRVEWLEPNENIVTQQNLAPSTLTVLLPVGFYRMVLTDQNHTQTRTVFENVNPVNDANNDNQVGLPGPIWIQRNQNYLVNSNDILCPEAAFDPDSSNLEGPVTSNPYSAHFFTTRQANAPAGNLQPMRMVFKGNGVADPVMRRQRTLGSFYSSSAIAPEVAPGVIPGQFQFRSGNEMFGTGFTRFNPTQFAWFPNGGSYTAYAAWGPLAELYSLDFTTFDGQTDVNHVFTNFPQGLPTGWTSFDMPGPSQATTGYYLPSEKLASALANGVQVLGDTEQDVEVDAPTLYADFQAEFASTSLNDYLRPPSLTAPGRSELFPFSVDPFVVGGRTTTLAGYGTATSLFVPVADNAPLGGAPVNQNWTLADFITQGLGTFTVVHRPRGPQGLFTLQGPPVQAGATPALSAWWSSLGPLSFGKTNGSFDALELLRGESLNPADPSAWFAEFLQVRSDWFNLLNFQTPGHFTKAMGLSSALYSIDTPVGLARTYVETVPVLEVLPNGDASLPTFQAGVQSGAMVASTGPFLDVSVGTAGPGQLVPGPVQTANLVINLWRSNWMPVDEVRVVVNGAVVQTIPAASLVPSGSDPRQYSTSVAVPMPNTGTDAWIVVEAGVPLATTGPYAVGTPWNFMMRGIYPIAVSNPIFVSVTGNASFTPPLQ